MGELMSEELLSTDNNNQNISKSKVSQRIPYKLHNMMNSVQPRRFKTLCQEDTRDLLTQTRSMVSEFQELLTIPNLRMMLPPQPNKLLSWSQLPTSTPLIPTFHSLEPPSTEM